VVWAVQRNYHFATKEQPAVEAALAALLKKYGAPSKPPTTDPRDRNQYIIWVYDAQGRALGAGGAALARQCDSMFSAHFGTDQTSINEIETGRPGPNSAKECDSVAVVAASVQTVIATPGSAQLAVNNLIVWMADGARHRASVDATRAVVAAAAKARDNKSTEELQKRGAPKL
jgi:hypothetical protein